MDNNVNKKNEDELEKTNINSENKEENNNNNNNNKDLNSLKIKLMNFYNKESKKIIKYSLIVLSVLFFIYLIFILLPQNTIKGVDSNSFLKQDSSRVDIDFVFTVVEIPEKYTTDETILYTSEILKQIDSKKSQHIYTAVIDYLSSTCTQKLNKNNRILFDSLMKKMNQPYIIENFNGKNLVKHTNLQLCKNDIPVIEEPNALDHLERQKIILENKKDALLSSMQFDKDAYGDAYDETIGVKKYKNKSQSAIMEDNIKINQLNEIKEKEREIQQKIERIKEEKQKNKMKEQSLKQNSSN